MKRTLTPAGMVVAAVIAVVVVVGLAWAAVSVFGGDDEHDHATDSHLHIDPVTDDPYVAATSTISAILSYAPAEQATVFDQYAAVRDRLTGQLAELADNPPTGEDALRQTPEYWDSWAESGDRVRALVERDEDTATIADTDTEGVVTVTVRELVFHPGGETTPLRNPYTVEANVVVEDDIWKLASYDITDTNTSITEEGTE